MVSTTLYLPLGQQGCPYIHTKWGGHVWHIVFCASSFGVDICLDELFSWIKEESFWSNQNLLLYNQDHQNGRRHKLAMGCSLFYQLFHPGDVKANCKIKFKHFSLNTFMGVEQKTFCPTIWLGFSSYYEGANIQVREEIKRRWCICGTRK